ncbi:MAG: aminotransferase class III-fold pyridoxal phosphate-dependent enzyme, partial [Candidatus Limnocylindrales bacterium]
MTNAAATATTDRSTGLATARASGPSGASTASGADHLSPALARYFQRRWDHGEGHRLFDAEGHAYLDFACGLAVTVLGHRHPGVTAAIHQQVDRLLHVCSGLGYVEPVSALAEAIAAVMPSSLDSVFLANSGTEAVEGAMKLCRRAT